MNPNSNQGIRFLRSINALNPAYLPGDRRDHHSSGIAQGATPGFTAVPSNTLRHRPTSLRRLVTAERNEDGIADGFIRQRIRPQLKDGAARLQEIAKQSSDSPNPVVQDRIDTISSWTKKADLLFPVVSKFLGKATNKTDLSI